MHCAKLTALLTAGRSIKLEPPSAVDVAERKVARPSTSQNGRIDHGAVGQASGRASKRGRSRLRGRTDRGGASSSSAPRRKKRREAKRYACGVGRGWRRVKQRRG